MNEKAKKETIKQVLSNDEISSDQELVIFFQKELNLSKKAAQFYVNQRNDFLSDVFHENLKDYNSNKKTI